MPGWSTKRYGSFGVGDVGQPRPMKRLTDTMRVLGVLGLCARRLADLTAARRRGSAPPTAAAAAWASGRHSATPWRTRGDQRMGGAQVDADGDAPLVRVGRLPGFGDLQQGHGSGSMFFGDDAGVQCSSVEAAFDVLSEAVHEHQRAHLLRPRRARPALVEQARQIGQHACARPARRTSSIEACTSA
jgi:hypothetical protein